MFCPDRRSLSWLGALMLSSALIVPHATHGEELVITPECAWPYDVKQENAKVTCNMWYGRTPKERAQLLKKREAQQAEDRRQADKVRDQAYRAFREVQRILPPAVVADTPEKRAACVAKGGEVLGGTSCILPARDAGRPCSSGRQCQYGCRLEDPNRPVPRGKPIGTCARDNSSWGCITAVENNKRSTSVCIP